MTEARNPELEKMKGQLAELKEALSRERKAGNDVFIAQLKIFPIPAKLKMAEATQTEKDFNAARKLLDEARAELAIANPHFEEKFKNIPEAFEQVSDCIRQAKEAIKANKKEEAKELYAVIKEHFPLLSREQKAQVMAECREIMQQVSK